MNRLTRIQSLMSGLLLMLALSLAGCADEHHSGHDGHDHSEEHGTDDTEYDHADDNGSSRKEHHHKDEQDSDHEGHGYDEKRHGGKHEDGHLEVSAERAAKAGITLQSAGPATITDALLLYGRTEPDPQQVSHVRARYPGLIRSIGPALGASVKAGEVIATIESNDSLQRYSIRAPISGTVVQRHANTGEFAGEEALLTIANYSKLWVALSVFPQEAERIRAGQAVRLQAGERSAQSQISFINPGTGERPSIMARMPLDNGDGQWSPGLLVEGEVIVAKQSVPIAAPNKAIQTVDNQTVVFVQSDDGFEVAAVTLGKRDENHSQVLTGLMAGQRIAVANSYLLKAELEKSGASHDH